MGRYAQLFLVVLAAGACGEPILRNAPRPDPGAVAGVAAAAAAAATLADPQAAAKKQEQKKQGEPEQRSVEVRETVPADVFDRLDHGAPSAPVARDAGVGDASAGDAGAVPVIPTKTSAAVPSGS